MLKNIIGIIVSYIFVFMIIGLAKLVEKKGKEASRKFIHIFLGFWWCLAMYFFDNVWFASFVPATFVVINYISVKKDVIKVMERDDKHKDGFGTVYYAISLLILAIWTFGIIKNPQIGLVRNICNGFRRWLSSNYRKKYKE